MRSRVLSAAGLSVTALALATSFAGTASAADSGISVAGKGGAVSIPATAAGTCYSNLEGDTGTALTSQNFEASFDQYDGEIADDVKVGKKGCKIKSIDVVGQYYNGFGPADSITLTFYKNKKGMPGSVVSTKTVNATDSAGSFNAKYKGKLKKGTYWMSAVVNMDFAVGGQWGFENTSNSIGAAGMFQNPGDGFATGCTTWGDAQACFAGTAPGTDYMFQINK